MNESNGCQIKMSLSPLKMFLRWSNVAAYIFTQDNVNHIIYWNGTCTYTLTVQSNSDITNGFQATYARGFMYYIELNGQDILIENHFIEPCTWITFL